MKDRTMRILNGLIAVWTATSIFFGSLWWLIQRIDDIAISWMDVVVFGLVMLWWLVMLAVETVCGRIPSAAVTTQTVPPMTR